MTVGKFQTHEAKKFKFVYYCVCHWNDVKKVSELWSNSKGWSV